MPRHAHRTLTTLQLTVLQKQGNGTLCPVPRTRKHHVQRNHTVHHYKKSPQGVVIHLLTPQTVRSSVRYAQSRRPTNQTCPLRVQTMGIYAKPQRDRNRESGPTHAQEVLEKSPRQPRVRPI